MATSMFNDAGSPGPMVSNNTYDRQNNTNVLLGFPDEIIAERFRKDVDFTTSKIGGQPDWINLPPPSFSASNCSLCGSASPLIVQIYAPLESSTYHRTLYIFACIQPSCWNKTESWKCFRGQKSIQPDVRSVKSTLNQQNLEAKPSDWLSIADDWGSDEEENQDQLGVNMDQDEDESFEANKTYDNAKFLTGFVSMNISDNNKAHQAPSTPNENETFSSSSSNTNSPISKTKGTIREDPNANPSPVSSGAIGGETLADVATAEIEVDDEDTDLGHCGIVAVETSDMETYDLNNTGSSNILKFFSPEELGKASAGSIVLDNQSVASSDIRTSAVSNNFTNVSTCSTLSCFTPYFLAVDEEVFIENDQFNDHERKLLIEYKAKDMEKDDISQTFKSDDKKGIRKSKCDAASQATDTYEKVMPKHGDVFLHKMITTIERNPGQVIRYTQDINQKPLYISKPLTNEVPSKCNQCQGALVCELQLLPSLIPALKMQYNPDSESQKPENAISFSKNASTKSKSGNVNQGNTNTMVKKENIQDSSLIEFGSVMIYTCQKSCTSSASGLTSIESNDCLKAYTQEQVMLQSESI